MKMKNRYLLSIPVNILILACLAVTCEKPTPPPVLEEPEPIPTYVKDIDNNIYDVKVFGNKVWMTENLKVTRYDTKSPRSGDTIIKSVGNIMVDINKPYYKDIKNVHNSPYTDNLTEDIRNSLGLLYNWCAAVGAITNNESVGENVQGICPNGWRLPTSADWDTLCTFLDGKGVAGKKLKSIYGWYTSSGAGNNESGMNCFPAGLAGGNFVSLLGQQTMFWCPKSQISNTKAEVLTLVFDQEEANILVINKIQANSVRCVKDITTP